MPQKADILLITVTDVETTAVLTEFREPCGGDAKVHQIGDRSFLELGKIHEQSIWLMRCQMGSGGIGSSLQDVSKAINALEPRAAIMVGIAMGIDKKRQSIGEVLVSRKLTLYEQRRIGEQVIVRGDRVTASGLLLSRFDNARSVWRKDPPVKVSPGLILTGEKLVDDLEYRRQLLTFEPEAVGAEMEGAGLYVACADAGVPWIVVKAICDWGDGNKRRRKEERQTLAATNAAKFVLHAFSIAPLLPRESSISGPSVGHLYWLGSDLADAYRHARDGEPITTVAKCLSQAALHFRKAGLRQPAIQDRLPELANAITMITPEQWTQASCRFGVANAINEVKGQVNVYINTIAGDDFDPWNG